MNELLSNSLCLTCRQPIPQHQLNNERQLVNSLVEQIPLLDERWMQLDIEELCENFEEQLNRWRVESHQTIDQFFERKCRELHQVIGEKLDQQRKEIIRLQSEVNDSMNIDQIDSLVAAVHALKQELTRIEGNDYFRMITRPLIIDKKSIEVTKLETYHFNLLTLPKAHRTLIHTENSWKPLASNNRYLLKHQAPNLSLVNRELDTIKQVPWRHGLIWDICWCSKLTRFIVLTVNHIFLFDDTSLSIETIRATKGKHWYSCTCSDTSLYLSTAQTGSSISEFNLSPSIVLKRHWQPPDTCKNDEWIHDLKYGNETLAVIIGEEKKERRKRMELRSCKTLERLWLLRLDIVDLQNRSIRCCFLTNDEWLLIDSIYSRLLHVSNDGIIKQSINYDYEPTRASLFGSNLLVVSNAYGLQLHQLFNRNLE